MHIDLGWNPGRVVTQPDSLHIAPSLACRRTSISTGPVRSIEPLRVTALNAVTLAGQATHYRGTSPQVYRRKTARQGKRKRRQEFIGSFFARFQYRRVGRVRRHHRGSVAPHRVCRHPMRRRQHVGHAGTPKQRELNPVPDAPRSGDGQGIQRGRLHGRDQPTTLTPKVD